ncbi:19997_t:CDS:2 [Entrophospora sp. SA101]|nr:19997_t:CDS:2 [Entrophospora sp. SA101]
MSLAIFFHNLIFALLQGNLADGKVSRVVRYNYAIRIKDKSHGPCFGDKDLWMKNNFNGYENCSSDKDDYQEKITTLNKFWVIEYEVFQVIKK